ncbi:hypothetical protein PISMIDRAFT_17829 [Pisolithus microcarpus 441]|uniref:Uncharacterized protein n=1 Tax=Pisolithus microcarpus 441 TaxID=765257 RepID=A0A0C9Y9T0_9AGAM|nr:hypothetical protein PISMIDRAFT_17829 [Pisolithus microcarpus 441]
MSMPIEANLKLIKLEDPEIDAAGYQSAVGALMSVIRLEKSYVVVSVSPVEEAYGSFVPVPRNVYLSISSFVLPKLRQVQYQLLSSSLSDRIHDEFETLLPALMGEDSPSSSSNPPEH